MYGSDHAKALQEIEALKAEVVKLSTEQLDLIEGHVRIELHQNAESAESLKLTRDRAEKAEAERDRLRPALEEAYESLQTCCLTTGSPLDILIFKAIHHKEG